VVVATWPVKARKGHGGAQAGGPHRRPGAPSASPGRRQWGKPPCLPIATCFPDKPWSKSRTPVPVRWSSKHREPVTVEPGGEALTVQLEIIEPRLELAYNAPLEVLVIDADDEEILAREEITLKVEINDWS